jgi:hypothetical protein
MPGPESVRLRRGLTVVQFLIILTALASVGICLLFGNYIRSLFYTGFPRNLVAPATAPVAAPSIAPATPSVHDQAYWQERIDQLKVGMTRAEVEAILPVYIADCATIDKDLPSLTVSYFLDDHWLINNITYATSEAPWDNDGNIIPGAASDAKLVSLPSNWPLASLVREDSPAILPVYTEESLRNMIAQVKIGMTRAEAEKLLPPEFFFPAGGLHVTSTMIQGSFQCRVYQVDEHWAIGICYDYTGYEPGNERTTIIPANKILTEVKLTRQDMKIDRVRMVEHRPVKDFTIEPPTDRPTTPRN